MKIQIAEENTEKYLKQNLKEACKALLEYERDMYIPKEGILITAIFMLPYPSHHSSFEFVRNTVNRLALTFIAEA